MLALINGLNTILSGVFDLAFRPLTPLGAFWSLAVFSLGFGAASAWLHGRVSNREGIAAARSRLQAHLIALRLYQHSFGIFLRLQARILLDLLLYLRHAALPLSILAALSILALIQLDGRYGLRPLEVGERTLVTVRLTPSASTRLLDGLSLAAGEGVVVESEAARVPEKGEATWRVRALSGGNHSLRIRGAGDEISKVLQVGLPGPLVASRRVGAPLQLVRHPGESPLENPGISAVYVRYPRRCMSFLDRRIDWLFLFCSVSVVSGYLVQAVRDRIG